MFRVKLHFTQFPGRIRHQAMSATPSSDKDYSKILETLREGFESGANASLENRKANLTALKHLIVENEDAICEALWADLYKVSEILKLRFDHIFFTGSTNVGKIVMKAAAENLTPVTLELGGKSPVIIDSDVDLYTTARRTMWGKLLNAGQVCVAPDYAIIIGDSERRDKFVEECIKNVKEFYGENAKESEHYGRLVNTIQFDRLSKVLSESSGKMNYGGAKDRDSKYIEPTIISVEEGDATLKDELFGPILPILTLPSLDDAIKYVNRREKPLVSYLFSGRKQTIDRVTHETSSGTLTINDTIMHMTLETLPFGGVGHSGTGKYHGKSTFDTFSHKKSVFHRTAGFEKLLWMRYPPFNADKLTWARRLSMKIRLPF
uniref:Aldedh domain-containing protein n=1 Tax=Bursaphelenchus xylophilus TaxID=6326 RepID=A0A1I7SBH1_BURXY